MGPRNDTLLSIVADPAEEYSPLATVLDGSKLESKATGLVATSRHHATPAAFASHVDNRNNESEIMEQIVYEDIDVVFGGGSQHLLPNADGGKRADGENLIEVLLDRGYQYVDNEAEMFALSSGKACGLFASGHMQPDIDRAEFAPEEPSLSNMTEKAIALLSEDKDGFFLMVEDSQVDWAGHVNDLIYEVTDFLAFDKAVKVAVDFTKADGHTLVIIFPDHNTSGMTIGSYYDSEYDDTSMEDVVNPLEGMNITAARVTKKIGEDLSYDNIKSQLKTWWCIDATDDDVTEILELYNNGEGLSLDYAISEIISRNHTVIGWTTHEHLFVEVGEVFSEDNGDGVL